MTVQFLLGKYPNGSFTFAVTITDNVNYSWNTFSQHKMTVNIFTNVKQSDLYFIEMEKFQ